MVTTPFGERPDNPPIFLSFTHFNNKNHAAIADPPPTPPPTYLKIASHLGFTLSGFRWEMSFQAVFKSCNLDSELPMFLVDCFEVEEKVICKVELKRSKTTNTSIKYKTVTLTLTSTGDRPRHSTDFRQIASIICYTLLSMRKTSQKTKRKSHGKRFEKIVLDDPSMIMSILQFVGFASLAKCSSVNKDWTKCADICINKFLASNFTLNKQQLSQLRTSPQLHNSWKHDEQLNRFTNATVVITDEIAMKQLEKNKEIMDALNNTHNLIKLMNLVKENDTNTFIAIEFPLHILKKQLPKSYSIKISELSQPNINNIISKNQKFCFLQLCVCPITEANDYYDIFLERQILDAIFGTSTIQQYMTNNNGKNLLLLDFSHTLCVERGEGDIDRNNAFYSQEWQSEVENDYTYQYIPRNGLNDFLVFVCKYFNVWIITGSISRKDMIIDLNKQDGINIKGVIWNCLYKERFTKYIYDNSSWFNMNFNCTDFLLIDDEKIYQQLGVNTIQVPKFTWNRGEKMKFQEMKHHDPVDKNVFDKLKPWLKQWNDFTNVKRMGTTQQFIDKHGTPEFIFTQLDEM